MNKAEDLKVSENRIHSLFIGRSGTGKSVAALSFPRPIYWMCLDNRLGLLEGEKDVFYDVFEPNDGFNKVEQAIEREILSKRGPKFPWKTVVFAGISSTLRRLLRDSISFIGTKESGSEAKGAQKFGSLIVPGLRNYLYVSSAFSQIFDNGLFLIPCNLIVEAHIVNDYDDKGNISGERILATDKLSEEIPGNFDEVWEFRTKNSAIVGQASKYEIAFNANIARSTMVKKIGFQDWTNKNLHQDIFSGLKERK